MSLFSILPDASSLKQTVSNAITKVKDTWTSTGTTKAEAKPDLTEMLGTNTATSKPYNTGSDLSGTSVKKDSLSSTTTTATSTASNVATDIDSISSSDKAENKSEYDILYYPEALLAEGSLGKRYPHAMSIFMNVNSKSKLGKYMESSGQIAKKRLDQKTLDLTENTSNQGVATNVGGMAGDFLVEIGMAAKFKRFTGCIMLPLPLDLTANYGANYNTAGAGGVLGTALKIGMSGSNAKQTLEGLVTEAISGAARDLTKNTLTAVAKNIETGTFGGVDNAGGLFDKVVGTIRNPRTEQVFEKMDIRSFTFSWQINITSVKEWNTIRSIVSLLKENMHPEIDGTTSGTYMVMPNEFDIEFYEKVGSSFSESTTIPKIATSALSQLEVNYTPQGNWIAFEGTMIPPFVLIRTVFKEMEPLHRTMVSDVAATNKKFTFPDVNDRRRGF